MAVRRTAVGTSLKLPIYFSRAKTIKLYRVVNIQSSNTAKAIFQLNFIVLLLYILFSFNPDYPTHNNYK